MRHGHGCNAYRTLQALIVAMIEQAINDIRHGRPQVRQTAYRWLQHDPSCAELCDCIGLNRKALTETLDHEF